jgi:hypothetical protein
MNRRLRSWGSASLRLLLAAAAMLDAAWVPASPTVIPIKEAPSGGPASGAAAALVNTLVANGGGVTVVPGSAQYIGRASASGQFVNAGTDPNISIGINAGVVLTTGDARFVSGSVAFDGDLPNKNTGFTSGILNSLKRNDAAGSALFAPLTSVPTFNASILRFQVIPSGGTLTVNYVYGSEDYNSGVNSGLPPDVLGFFVNGVNYALVPGTNTPVSAAGINCGGPTSGPANGVNPQNCSLYRDNAPFVGRIDTELNGLTVTLQMTAPVIPNQVNTIELGIANAFDPFVDSAVFIEARSMRSH